MSRITLTDHESGEGCRYCRCALCVTDELVEAVSVDYPEVSDWWTARMDHHFHHRVRHADLRYRMMVDFYCWLKSWGHPMGCAWADWIGCIYGYLALLAKQSDPPRRFAGCLFITECTLGFWIFVILAITAKG